MLILQHVAEFSGSNTGKVRSSDLNVFIRLQESCVSENGSGSFHLRKELNSLLSKGRLLYYEIQGF